MPRDLFGAVTTPPVSLGNRKWYTVPLSLAAHVALIIPIVLVPLFATDILPSPREYEGFFVSPPPPPEPPPPVTPKAEKTEPPPNPDAAPVDVPDSITPERPPTSISRSREHWCCRRCAWWRRDRQRTATAAARRTGASGTGQTGRRHPAAAKNARCVACLSRHCAGRAGTGHGDSAGAHWRHWTSRRSPGAALDPAARSSGDRCGEPVGYTPRRSSTACRFP